MESLQKLTYFPNPTKITDNSWAHISNQKYIKANNEKHSNKIIAIKENTGTSNAWYAKIDRYVNIVQLNLTYADISYSTSEYSDEQTSCVLWCMKDILNNNEQELDNDQSTYVLDLFFERAPMDQVIVDPSKIKKVNITKKIRVSRSDVMIQIPIMIVVNAIDSIFTQHMTLNCNTVISDLISYLTKLTAQNTVNLYDREGLITSMSMKLYERVVPRQIIFAVARSQYKIYKRLELSPGGSWGNGVDNWDAFTLKPKRPVLICGFTAYTPNSADSVKDIVYKFKLNSSVVREGKRKIKYDGTNKTVPVELEPNEYLLVNDSDSLVMMQYVSGGSTFRGKKYAGPPQPDMFTFSSAPESENGTSDTEGQIPEIFYI
jgi:hypothetical protein